MTDHNKQSFEERLKRINEARGIDPNTPLQQRQFEKIETPTRRRKSGGQGILKLLLVSIAVIGLCTVGIIYYMLSSIGKYQSVAIAEASSYISGNEFEYKNPYNNKLDQMLKRWLAPGGDPRSKPIDFLPPPPEGWIIVDQRAPRDPELLAKIEAAWDMDLPGALPFEQNLGHARFERLVKLYKNPGIEARFAQSHRTTALYMHPRGEFVEFQLSFLHSQKHLGEAGVSKSWLAAAKSDVEDDLKTNQIIEEITFAGLKGFNRTDAVGKSLINRPIGTHFDVPNGMRLTIPLRHNAVMQINALTTPNDVQDIISGLDRTGISKFLEHKFKTKTPLETAKSSQTMVQIQGN